MKNKSNHTDQISILMVGPLTPPIGGTRVLFQRLTDSLMANAGIIIDVIDVRPIRRAPLRAILLFCYQIMLVLKKLFRFDVLTLHCNVGSLWLYGSVLYFIARFFRKPLIITTFGGNSLINDHNKIRRSITIGILKKINLYIGETKSLVEEVKSKGVHNSYWIPNSRPMKYLPTPPNTRECKRFVFASHVSNTKGINELISAGEQLPNGITVDVYGPLRDNYTAASFTGCKRVRYKGVINHKDVITTLEQYDALVLPTYHPGEGYPGIIIEAYAAGLPVICTDWRSLPEIVNKTCGSLVTPKDPESLFTTMSAYVKDKNYFQSLLRGVIEQRKQFDEKLWQNKFVSICREYYQRDPK